MPPPNRRTPENGSPASEDEEHWGLCRDDVKLIHCFRKLTGLQSYQNSETSYMHYWNSWCLKRSSSPDFVEASRRPRARSAVGQGQSHKVSRRDYVERKEDLYHFSI